MYSAGWTAAQSSLKQWVFLHLLCNSEQPEDQEVVRKFPLLYLLHFQDFQAMAIVQVTTSYVNINSITLYYLFPIINAVYYAIGNSLLFRQSRHAWLLSSFSIHQLFQSFSYLTRSLTLIAFILSSHILKLRWFLTHSFIFVYMFFGIEVPRTENSSHRYLQYPMTCLLKESISNSQGLVSIFISLNKQTNKKQVFLLYYCKIMNISVTFKLFL